MLRKTIALFAATCAFAWAGSTTYTYDDLGRLRTSTDSDGVVTEYRYDPAGNRTSHVITLPGDFPVSDSIPTLGMGNNLINLSGWPTGSAPSGTPSVSGWNTSATYLNESRWARVPGPGSSGYVTALDVGQTEPDNNGGGFNPTNTFLIDPTKAYEFSIYFKKYDLAYQNLYFGTRTAGQVKYISNNNVYTNPYFVSWNLTTQNSVLEEDKWYKVVAYVLPEGYPMESTANWGGVYDLETGAKVRNVNNFRWSEDRTTNSIYARFFTYYSQTEQNRFTNYFYQPEVRVTNTSYTPVVPSLSIGHANASEGDDITYTVNLSQATTVDVKVNYSVGNGSASSGDYTATSGTLVIPTGATQGVITVPTAADSTYETDESIELTLSSPVRATLSESSETAYITNNDSAPTFSITTTGSQPEGSALTYTVTKSGSTQLSHSVQFATGGGSATAGSDYTAASGTLTFSAGQSSRSFTVITANDTLFEGAETVTATLSAPTGGATIAAASAVGTIVDDDNSPVFSVANATVTEGGIMTVYVQCMGETNIPQSVDYATSTGSASSSDFSARSGTLAFANGTNLLSFTVPTTQDSIYEGAESFTITLSNPQGGSQIGSGSATGTINDNDSAPSFSINNVSRSEGTNLTFTVTKTGSSTLPHNVSYATSNGSATAGSDYTSKSGTLSFSASQSSRTVTISGIEDSTYENSETFYVNLSGATNGATISDNRGNGTITNDDGAPSFRVNNVSRSEGTNLTFTVTKTGSSAQTHNVNYATANGSATGGSDYVVKSGTLSFSATQSSRTVTISGIEDSVYENSESFYVNLSSPTNGATINDSQGVGTITNDDSAPSFAVNNVSATEGGSLTFTVTKSGSTAVTHNVSYATANGTAAAGSDYTIKSGTLSFTSGQTSKTVTVSSIQDSNYEANETFYLNLSSATNGASIADSQGVGTISNDDTANNPPTFTGSSYFEEYLPFYTGGLFSVHVNDDAGDTHTFEVISVDGDHASLSSYYFTGNYLRSNLILYSDDPGTTEIVVRVTDNGGLSATRTYWLEWIGDDEQ